MWGRRLVAMDSSRQVNSGPWAWRPLGQREKRVSTRLAELIDAELCSPGGSIHLGSEFNRIEGCGFDGGHGVTGSFNSVIYLHAHHTTLSYGFETPSGFPLERRVATLGAAVEAAMAGL